MATLQGKTALVTGASRGIGRATALALAVEGTNYIGDTLMFAATVLLAGWGGDRPAI